MVNTPPLIKPTFVWTRRILYLSAVLVIVIGISLYVFSESTDLYFAWTIQVPLTAAFLGAGYLASFLLEFLSAREPTWAGSRIALPAVFMFTFLTLIVTLTHLDKFHFNAPQWFTVVGTWAWLLVYALVPIMQIVQLWRQVRTLGSDPVPRAPLPAWMRVILVVQAVILLILGVIGTFAPDVLASLWVWQLTPLTARAVGAWFIGLGMIAAHASYENELTRLLPMMVSWAAFGLLVLVALLRYPNAVGLDWSTVGVWLFVALMASLLGVGTAGMYLYRRLPPAQ